MPNHDIIDNRNERLVDHIQQILPSADKAKFAVGYFFLSGLEAIGKKLDSLKELRLLIGNTSNLRTIEQMTEGYKRLEFAEEAAKRDRFAKNAELKNRAVETSVNLKETVEVMDQTDEGEALIHSLVKMVEEKRLKVKVYNKSRLHAKAYIFDYLNPNPGNDGIAIVGSSNLTLSGLTDNTELNVLVHDKGNPTKKGRGNHGKLSEWFDELWEDALDFEPYLMTELKQSWAASLATPYDIYMKTLYELVKDRLDEGEGKEILWDDEITRELAEFQKIAVRQAIQIIRDNGGCFISDVVGLGKSYIGAGIVKHFERTEHARPLIICPKPLEEMWVRYNEKYHLNANILPMSMLRESGPNLLEDVKYRDRNFVLIDESHHFRHHSNQRYAVLQSYLSTGRKVCLLTATPRNSRATDVYNQIKLFHAEDKTDLPINPPDLKEFFKLIDNGSRKLQEILRQLLIRRTRRHILREFGFAGDTQKPLREMSDPESEQYLDGDKRAYVQVGGKHQFFPRRELETLRYSIESTYDGLYQTLRGYLGGPKGIGIKAKPGQELTYARYGLWHYVNKDMKRVKPYSELQRAGINLRGLVRTMLFKRFESSVYAFRETLKRMIKTHDRFIKSLNEGVVPAGDKAIDLLGRSSMGEEDLLDALTELSGRYDVEHFDVEKLREHIHADKELLEGMLDIVKPITPIKDDKLQKFIARLKDAPIVDNKCLVFTQYADTAKYIYENLNKDDERKDIDFIYGTDKSKSRIVGRFAPIANPEFRFQKGDTEIRLLVATDVLAEGLNMQDCSVVLNYDLHWNPVRLIQRFGRIDRIGSEHDVIWGLNFLPETGLEKNLGIKQVLRKRIEEIHETIGEDAAILDKTEKLNPDAMYTIYEKKTGQLSLFEDGEEEFIDLNEAEEMLRSLRKNDPDEYDRVAGLRDGIRSGINSETEGFYIFCQKGRYQQLFHVARDGKVISRDIPTVLGRIRASHDIPAPKSLPKNYNSTIMKVKQIFTEEALHRDAQREHATSLNTAQRYILRELRTLYSREEDEEIKSRINALEKGFRMSPTAAINRELNFLRRNGIAGKELIKTLGNIYHQHRLGDRVDQKSVTIEKEDIPRIICSEAFM